MTTCVIDYKAAAGQRAVDCRSSTGSCSWRNCSCLPPASETRSCWSQFPSQCSMQEKTTLVSHKDHLYCMGYALRYCIPGVTDSTNYQAGAQGHHKLHLSWPSRSRCRVSVVTHKHTLHLNDHRYDTLPRTRPVFRHCHALSSTAGVHAHKHGETQASTLERRGARRACHGNTRVARCSAPVE